MTIRENVLAILHYKPYEKMPVVAFGFWGQLLEKWAQQGNITQEECDGHILLGDHSKYSHSINQKLGFDFSWGPQFSPQTDLFPKFDQKMIKQLPDGSQIIRDEAGLIVRTKPGVVSIPTGIGTSLTDRKAWEELYLPKMQYHPARLDLTQLQCYIDDVHRELPLGLNCGSLMGTMRNFLGVEGLSYLYADDEELYVEILEQFANLSYLCTEAALASGVKFDFAHFWEDICFKNGPLVTPSVFNELVGPHYKRITTLLRSYGVDIISLDCDGCIDTLIPTWIHNGVNIMFPIEVGTWNGNIEPWRKQYGKKLLGVGGMRKGVFAEDYAAIDKEVERLTRLIRLGGFIPCPDHRLPPDAKFENVQYYCDKMHNLKL